jgi:hypothetical protein
LGNLAQYRLIAEITPLEGLTRLRDPLRAHIVLIAGGLRDTGRLGGAFRIGTDRHAIAWAGILCLLALTAAYIGWAFGGRTTDATYSTDSAHDLNSLLPDDRPFGRRPIRGRNSSYRQYRQN